MQLFRNGREQARKDLRYRIRSLDTDIEVHEALRDEAEKQAATEVALISELRREREQLVDALMENSVAKIKAEEEKEEEEASSETQKQDDPR